MDPTLELLKALAEVLAMLLGGAFFLSGIIVLGGCYVLYRIDSRKEKHE